MNKINWKKSIFLFTFSIVILFASFFMITESARYYRFFYDEGSWQPLYLAALLELFVLVLAVIRVGKVKFFHAIQKIIMMLVFFAIIFAAGMNAVNPTLETIEETAKQEKLSQLLEEEYKTLKKDQEVFDKQKQRRNTAIAAHERRKIVEDLKKLFSSGDIKTNKGQVALVNILLLFGIRFLVQTANVFCASMLGVYFRRPDITEEEEEKKSYKELVRIIYPDAECKLRPQHEKELGKMFFIFVGHKNIGRGKLPKTAWKDAYENIKKIK